MPRLQFAWRPAVDATAAAQCRRRSGRRTRDPEDEGIRACCEGYGVQLEVPAGAEHLIAFLAATQVYLPSDPDQHEREVESFLADVEEQRAAGGLERFRRPD